MQERAGAVPITTTDFNNWFKVINIKQELSRQRRGVLALKSKCRNVKAVRCRGISSPKRKPIRVKRKFELLKFEPGGRKRCRVVTVTKC